MAEEIEDTKSEDDLDRDLLHEAKERFAEADSVYGDEYQNAETQFNFLYGDQWPQNIRAQRQAQGRPCLTHNHCLPFAHQVINDIRQSRPSIRVSPVDDDADVETAEVLKGMIRNIEVSSNAENAYDTAALNSVGSGYGWIRVNTQWANDENFDKDIVISAPLNPFSVLIDPNHRNQDASDMEYAFIYEDIPHETFEELYPDAAEVDMEAPGSKEWRTEDTVKIAEYFYKEYDEYEISDGVNTRTVRKPRVMWCKISGAEVLEGPREWEGKYIPIVPVYGELVWNEGRRRAFSLIYQAMEPQQMHNFWLSANTETMALQPKAPYIGAVGQFKSKWRQWMNANTENSAILEYDPVTYKGELAPPPQRAQPPQASAGMIQGQLMAADAIKAALGMFNASIGQDGNEKSGKAIIARQKEGDNATYHFMDNLSVSMRQVGLILIDLIPKIYSGARIVRIIGEDGEAKNVPLNQPFAVDQMGNKVAAVQGIEMRGIYDLSVGKYDVVVDVGPSYSTKRQEVVETMINLAQADPRIMQVGADIFFKNLDVPQAKELSDRMKAVMDPALFSDDPQAVKMQQMAEAMKQMEGMLMQMGEKLKAKEENQAMEAEKTAAETKKIEAETAKTLAETAATIPALSPEVVPALVQSIQEIHGNLQDVGQAVDLMLSALEGNQAPVAPVQ